MHISELMPKNGLFDSHTHLIFREYPLSMDEIIEKSRGLGLTTILNVCTDLETSMQAPELSKTYNGYVKSFIGIDPQEVIPNPEHFMGLDVTDEQIQELKSKIEALYSANKESVIGIGETGMDFFWIKELDQTTQEKSKRLQQKLYVIHLEIAEKYNLPLTIHSRGAETECLEVLKQNTTNTKGIFHSFTGTYEQAKAILDSGNGLGVNGIVTFRNANSLRETYKRILGIVKDTEDPSYFYKKGIFFETDAPFLSPEGKRGEINYPYNVTDIYKIFTEFLSH